MRWIRPAGLALVLLLLMTSTALADSVQQLENNVRASLTTVGSTSDLAGPVRAQQSIQAPLAPRVSEVGTGPMAAAARRLASLTGRWRISAGITPESEVLGVLNGHIVSQRWTNYHVSVGLPLK
jgi:hypothetical protein